MKLVTLLLLCAIIGKMSAAPAPIRLAYYRAAPAAADLTQQLDEAEEEAEDDETDISEESTDFSQNVIDEETQDDDDDSEEQEPPPNFQKLFPIPNRNSPGHNRPLSSMMSEILNQGWNVPKRNPVQQQQQQRARNEIELARDDEDDDSDEDEDADEEEDEEAEDDLPDWNKLFPNADGPPAGPDSNTQSDIPASFRSAVIGGNRYVYVPASASRQIRRQPSGAQISRQYLVRQPPRSQMMYSVMPTSLSSNYMRHQPVYQSRPQYVMASNNVRRPQGVYYVPNRRATYTPYVSPYVPRYRYY